MRDVAGSRDIKMPGLWHQVQAAPFLALVALELDQLTKLLVKESLPQGESIPHDASLAITRVVNPGIAFGVSASATVSLLLPLAMIFASLVIYWRFERSNSTLLNVGVGLFVGGSLGNLVDRIAYGNVTDFIEVISSGGNVRTVFNVADLCIILGIVILEVFLIRLIIRLILKRGYRENYLTPFIMKHILKRGPREK